MYLVVITGRCTQLYERNIMYKNGGRKHIAEDPKRYVGEKKKN